MKKLLLIIIALSTLCISCKGKGTTSASNDNKHDSEGHSAVKKNH